MTDPGDRKEEFLALLRPHRDSLEAFARRHLRDRQAAEDVLQESAAAAFGSFDRFQPGTNFRAWMFAFVARTALHWNRRSGREATLALFPEPAAGDLPEALALEEAYEGLLADPSRIPAAIEGSLAGSLASLSDGERSVLLLRAIGDLKYREIADILGCPLGTVMGSLSRARSKMRRRLADAAAETRPARSAARPADGGAR